VYQILEKFLQMFEEFQLEGFSGPTTEAGAEKSAYRGLRGSRSRARRDAGPRVSARPMP